MKEEKSIIAKQSCRSGYVFLHQSVIDKGMSKYVITIASFLWWFSFLLFSLVWFSLRMVSACVSACVSVCVSPCVSVCVLPCVSLCVSLVYHCASLSRIASISLGTSLPTWLNAISDKFLSWLSYFYGSKKNKKSALASQSPSNVMSFINTIWHWMQLPRQGHPHLICSICSAQNCRFYVVN